MPRRQSKMRFGAIARLRSGVILLSVLSGCLPQPVSSQGHSGHNDAAPETAVTVSRSGPETTRSEPKLVAPVDPSPSDPVTAVMTIQPETVSPGDMIELQIQILIATAHYVHAEGDADGPFKPLVVNMTLPDGIEVLGDWYRSPTEKGPEDSAVYRETATVRRTLRILPTSPPQTLVITVELIYQVCTDELCWPLRKLKLSTPLSIQP